MVALGAEPCQCLDVLDAWESAKGKTELIYGLCTSSGHPRFFGDQIPPRRRASQAAAAALARLGATGAVASSFASVQIISATSRWRTTMRSAERMQLLFDLPEPFRRRLVAGLLAAPARSQTPPQEHYLDLILKDKVSSSIAESIRYWAGPGSLTRLTVDVNVEMADPREAPFLLSQAAAKSLMEAAVRIPLSWLQQVWARDIEVVEGCFVLEVLEASEDGTTMAVNAARWQKDRIEGLTQVVRPARVVIMEDGPHLWWTAT